MQAVPNTDFLVGIGEMSAGALNFTPPADFLIDAQKKNTEFPSISVCL